MAAVVEARDGPAFYWIKDTSEDEKAAADVSRKPGLKVGPVKNKDGKRKVRAAFEVPVKSNEKNLILKNKSDSLKNRSVLHLSEAPQTQEPLHQHLTKSKASLKDLCPEDKRRIANLIEELARVSEEKEESVQRLRDEQESFEKKIQKLEDQNRLIIQERGNLQQQYKECQELLGLYQQYLSQQQEKLSQSITELKNSRIHCREHRARNADCLTHSVSQRRFRVHLTDPGFDLNINKQTANSETRLSRAQDAVPDGSYLDALSGSNGRRPMSPDSTRSFIHAPPSRPLCNQHGTAAANICTEGFCEPISEVRVVPRLARHEPKVRHQAGCSTGHRGEVSHVSRLNWEEKRQLLLLQKKQLEVERERLQIRLAQQEERLLLQNQELKESHLKHRLQQEESNEAERNNDAGPCATVKTQSEVKEKEFQVLPESVRQPVTDVTPQECNGNLQASECRSTHDHCAVNKKDMATSPVHSQKAQSSPPLLPFLSPRTPDPVKMDSSLIELLDILSPFPDCKRIRMVSASSRKLADPLQQNSLFPPQGQSQNSQEELQESQILEDIFFIC